MRSGFAHLAAQAAKAAPRRTGQLASNVYWGRQPIAPGVVRYHVTLAAFYASWVNKATEFLDTLRIPTNTDYLRLGISSFKSFSEALSKGRARFIRGYSNIGKVPLGDHPQNDILEVTKNV